jgi:hypothetical protein
MANQPSGLRRLLNKMANLVMPTLLQSQFHTLASSRVSIMEIKGRKSGKTYLIPTEYALEENEVFILTSEAYTWWKNLVDGANVRVLLKGKWYSAYATIAQDPASIERNVRRILPFLKGDAFERACDDRVAIHLTLQP